LVAHHAECQQIESGIEIMNSIPDHEGEALWDGLLGFDRKSSLQALWVLSENQAERFSRQIGVDLPVKIVDVLFGPLNL
jgi:hypothetical protein